MARLNMAVGASAFCTYQHSAEYEPFPFVRSVFSTTPLNPYLLPSFLYPLKQFPIYNLLIILRSKVVIILQYPAYGCMGPADSVMGIGMLFPCLKCYNKVVTGVANKI